MFSQRCFKCNGSGYTRTSSISSFYDKCSGCSGQGYLNGGQAPVPSPYPQPQPYPQPSPYPMPGPDIYGPANVTTCYHQTSVQMAQAIQQYGFNPSSGGMPNGGIWLASNLNSIRPGSYGNNTILGVVVDLGRIKVMQAFDPNMSAQRLAFEGFDTVMLPNGDGMNCFGSEYIIYDPRRIRQIFFTR